MDKTIPSLALITSLSIAGTVNTDFSYQDYLDFGANKGRFQAGNSVTISSKDGQRNVYIEQMPDFGGANLTGHWAGEFNNIGGSYAISAAHMFSSARAGIGRGTALEFGGVRSRIVSTSLNFQNWSDPSNKYPNTNIPKNRDFVVQRMEKLNLNQSINLIKENFFSKDSSKLQGYAYLNNLSNILNNPDRYTMFARAGTGIQGIRTNGQGIAVADANKYFTGGLGTNAYDYSTKYLDGAIALDAKKPNENNFEDFAITGNPGDSGSGIYVFDNFEKQWYVLGVASTLPGCGSSSFKCTLNAYTLVNNLAIQEYKDGHTLVFNTANNSIYSGGVYSGSKRVDETIKTSDFNTRLQAMENDKDYVFTYHGSLVLKEDADLGSSVLYISEGLKFSVAGNYNFTHGGIVVDKNANVYYAAKTKEQDALVKMGEGILTITSSSPNGKLRVGQGSVTLKSEGVAFGSIYAINGANIILNHSGQVNADYFYFGINGANLELNGNSLTFGSEIKASDFGANINNTSKTKSTITLNGQGKGIYHGQINGNTDVILNRDYVFDGAINAKNLNVKGNIVFQAHPVVHNYIPEDTIYWSTTSGLDPIKTIDILQDESFQITPTTQNDLEAREFVFETISLENANFSQSSYTKVTANSINANNSTITIGSGKIYLDTYDGENVRSTPCGYENASEECKKYDAYDREFQYNSTLTEKSIENKEIYLFGNINLKNNSTIVFNQAFYRGNIQGDGTSSVSFDNSLAQGSIKVNQFSANNSHFLLEVTNNSNQLISATQKANGGGNYLYILPKERITKKILLVSLKDSQNVGSKMFIPKTYSTNFSIFKPSIEYKNVNGMDNWYLSNLAISENTHTINQANQAIGHISSNYVLEWNNLYKRMGELRDESSIAGLWVKVFGGEATFDSSYKTGFAEIQIGADKHNVYEDFELFVGGLLGASYYNLSNTLNGKMNGINAGIYTSFLFNNGFFVDLIAKYLHYKNDFSLILDGQTQSLDSKTGHFAIIASAEVGYRAIVGENFYIEPQIEFISGYLGKQVLKNDEVSLTAKGTAPLNFKTSVSAGYKKENFSLRAGIGAQLDLLNSGETEVKDFYQTHTFDGFKDSRMFINAGGTYHFADTNRLSFEIEHSFLGKFNVDYLINLTYRHGF